MPEKTNIPQTQALRDVLAERQRQIAKGHDAAHDDAHDKGELARAASNYAYHATVYSPLGHLNYGPGPSWPFERSAWKPESPRADLVKAGALILAEIERLDRDDAPYMHETEAVVSIARCLAAKIRERNIPLWTLLWEGDRFRIQDGVVTATTDVMTADATVQESVEAINALVRGMRLRMASIFAFQVDEESKTTPIYEYFDHGPLTDTNTERLIEAVNTHGTRLDGLSAKLDALTERLDQGPVSGTKGNPVRIQVRDEHRDRLGMKTWVAKVNLRHVGPGRYVRSQFGLVAYVCGMVTDTDGTSRLSVDVVDGKS